MVSLPDDKIENRNVRASEFDDFIVCVRDWAWWIQFGDKIDSLVTIKGSASFSE